MKRGQQQTGYKHRFFFRLGLTGLLLMLWPACLFPQPRVIVYDGYTGIHDVGIQNDTVLISTLIPGSPAEKAGLSIGDQILAIDGTTVSG